MLQYLSDVLKTCALCIDIINGSFTAQHMLEVSVTDVSVVSRRIDFTIVILNVYLYLLSLHVK